MTRETGTSQEHPIDFLSADGFTAMHEACRNGVYVCVCMCVCVCK